MRSLFPFVSSPPLPEQKGAADDAIVNVGILARDGRPPFLNLLAPVKEKAHTRFCSSQVHLSPGSSSRPADSRRPPRPCSGTSRSSKAATMAALGEGLAGAAGEKTCATRDASTWRGDIYVEGGSILAAGRSCSVCSGESMRFKPTLELEGARFPSCPARCESLSIVCAVVCQFLSPRTWLNPGSPLPSPPSLPFKSHATEKRAEPLA